jgi:hypothetical protein
LDGLPIVYDLIGTPMSFRWVFFGDKVSCVSFPFLSTSIEGQGFYFHLNVIPGHLLQAELEMGATS